MKVGALLPTSLSCADFAGRRAAISALTYSDASDHDDNCEEPSTGLCFLFLWHLPRHLLPWFGASAYVSLACGVGIFFFGYYTAVLASSSSAGGTSLEVCFLGLECRHPLPRLQRRHLHCWLSDRVMGVCL